MPNVVAQTNLVRKCVGEFTGEESLPDWVCVALIDRKIPCETQYRCDNELKAFALYSQQFSAHPHNIWLRHWVDRSLSKEVPLLASCMCFTNTQIFGASLVSCLASVQVCRGHVQDQTTSRSGSFRFNSGWWGRTSEAEWLHRDFVQWPASITTFDDCSSEAVSLEELSGYGLRISNCREI